MFVFPSSLCVCLRFAPSSVPSSYIYSPLYCVLCTVYYVLCIVYCVLCTVYCVLCIVYCVLCTVYCVLCIVYCVLCTCGCMVCSLVSERIINHHLMFNSIPISMVYITHAHEWQLYTCIFRTIHDITFITDGNVSM